MASSTIMSKHKQILVFHIAYKDLSFSLSMNDHTTMPSLPHEVSGCCEDGKEDSLLESTGQEVEDHMVLTKEIQDFSSVNDHDGKDNQQSNDEEQQSLLLADDTVVEDHVLVLNERLRMYWNQLTSSTQLAQYVELPMICVMGDTSSGKSSLLSNLSMIEFPSASQLTTKCPIVLHMTRCTPDQPKEARVNVQWRNTNRKYVNEMLPPFQERVFRVNPNTSHRNSDWDKAIPTMIREAMDHILTHTRQDVATDVIMVEIKSPTCSTDLTLVDLPGLVRAKAHDESDSLSQDIQNLVDTYLRNPRCIILAVLSAGNDFHNAQILSDAQRADPETKRTIPVITKPDLIDQGAEGNVLDLLMGKKLRFSLGFHMIKGRGQAALERKESIQLGLKEEQCFFEQVQPWKSMADHSCVGTPNLREKLGRVQLSMIQASLPAIIEEIQVKHTEATAHLKTMGILCETSLQRRKQFQEMSQSLVTELQASLTGKGGGSGKRRTTKKPTAAGALHEAFSRFRKLIKHSSLGMIRTVVEGAQVQVMTPRETIRGEVVHVDQDFACVDFVDEKDRHSEALFENFGLLSEEIIEENDVWTDGSKVFIARAGHVYDTLKQIPLHLVRTDPTWLKEKIAANRTMDLPCFLNVDVFKSLVEEFVEEDWKPHCLELVNNIKDILLSNITAIVEKALPPGRYLPLRQRMDQACRDAVHKLVQQAQAEVLTHLEAEKHPYTQNDELFTSMVEARHAIIRRELELALRLDEDQGVVLDTQAIKSVMDSVFERNKKVTTVDDFLAEEMETILESYGQVATRRVVDRTPMICRDVFRAIITSVQEALWSITDETLFHCMQDTPEFCSKYHVLRHEVQELGRALQILETTSI